MTRIEELRKGIANSYCRNILWVDDEIRPGELDEQLTKQYRERFLPAAEGIHKKGVLCHLQPFPQTDGTADPYSDTAALASAKQLARLTDAVILDWHLGADHPGNSRAILEDLVEVGGSRFIVILTVHPDVMEEFKDALDGVFSIKDGTYGASSSGQFVAFVNKRDVEGPDAAEVLLKAFHDLILKVYPDYIHWTAIELAASIKQYTPKWLSALPHGMDWAMLSEYCYSKADAADMLLENLFEDLKECVQPHELQAIRPENCSAADWPSAAQHLLLLDGLEETTVRRAIPLGHATPKLKSGAVEVIRASAHEGAKRFVESQDILTRFCEVVSGGLSDGTPLRPGSVFKTVGGDESEIFVCASQACDCLRAAQLFLLKGTEETNPKSGSTIIIFGSRSYRFDPKAESLLPVQVLQDGGHRKLDGYERLGLLRGAAARRLVSRFWAYATRAAVNAPTFARTERKGE